MTIHVRKCPGCQEERPEEEPLCTNCGWDLTQEPLRLPGQIDPIQTNSSPQPVLRHCLNGHPLEAGDELCFKCGATAAQEEECAEENPHSSETVIDGWVVINRLDAQRSSFEKFIVERHEHRALLTFYLNGINQDPSIYEVLKRLPKDYVPELLAYGTWQGRQYDVIDQNSQPNLFDLMTGPVDLETVRQIVKSIGRILHTLTENGLRHGNLRPENILISHRDPLGLLLTGFQYSHLSRFDIDTVPQPISEHYTAPEVIVGGISVSSDWWSLGMVILHLITKGQCFEGINEKAFRIHIVTRGVSLPKGIDPSLNLLLRGLLARDPDQRWQWTQVQSWLAGESVDAPSDSNFEETNSGPTLEFNNHSYVCPKAFALAAGEAANWEQAKDLLMRGVIVTWLEDRKIDSKILAGVRAASSLDSLSDDYKHALALMWINSSLPLLYKGEIVTSSWLLQNPIQGYEIITSSLIGYLRQMNREPHLCELYNRMERARKKAKVLEIELNEESFRVLALASSRQNLERQWAIYRRLYPGSDHSGLNSLMEREKITDEDLVILLGAQVYQNQSAEQILNQAHTLISQVEVPSYEEIAARQWFDVSRKELYREIEGRIANYSRCGILRVDEWANDFRVERRISLPRALVLLSVPKESWHEPPRQQYVSCLLEFFEKRTASQAQKGPLVRMRIGKSNTIVDLARIEGEEPKASSILEHLISRLETPVRIDRNAFSRDSDLERRLRHLVSRAQTYKRNTGIDSLYLGFPFLVIRESRSGISDAKPKIPPILLWPIKIDIESRDRVSIFFDRDREEVRVNPALIGLIGIEEAKKWIDVTKELLERSSIRTGDVIDAFSVLADPRERALCALPDSDYKVKPENKQVVCSAVFFHAEFMGQAIGEDLRQMRKESLAGTALETALRVNKDPMVSPQFLQIPEKDRYFTMETDPSQERAVFHARQLPGLLIEGPPGTGKSQTIVNIICDCIGRNQTVLVVCQKSAALEVLAKRLDAEGLREQFFYITNVNKDRSFVVQNIRAQIERIVQARRIYQSENIERERFELAEKIERLEREVDKHHEAIHAIDDQTGLSYRMLLGQLIDLEDQGSKLIDIPELRRHVTDLRQNQLSLIEEECSPIASIWLESSYEMSPLANLKVFSSDTAFVDDSIRAFFAFIAAEEERDKVYQMSTPSFDIQDPFPYQDWIKAHDQLLKKVDWEKIASWFQLFSSKGELEGPRIIKRLEELKQQLIFLNLNKHDQKLSRKLVDVPIEKIEAWVSLARKATSLNPLCFVQRASFQRQLEELKKELNSLDSNKCDQKLSSQLIDVPKETIEEWLSLLRQTIRLNSLCFVQRESIQKQLEELKKELNSLDSNKYDQKLSSKLIDVPKEKVEEWLSLTGKITRLNPLCFVQRESFQKQLEELKKELNSLDSNKYDQKISGKLTDVLIEKIEEWIVLARKSTNLNPLCFVKNEAIQKAINELNQRLDCLELNNHDKFLSSKLIDTPLSTLDQWIFLTNHQTTPKSSLSFFNPLRLIRAYRIKKILFKLGESLSLEAVSRLRVAAELEKERRAVRESVLKQMKNIYQAAEISELVSLKDLRLNVCRMIGDLTNVAQFQKIVSSLGEDPTFEKANLFQSASELETKIRPIRTIVCTILKQFYQWTEPFELSFLGEMHSQVDRMLEDLLSITQLQKVMLDLEEDKGFERACQFKSAIDLDLELRTLRFKISSISRMVYKESEIVKLVSPKDMLLYLDQIGGEITNIAQLQKIVSTLGENPSFEKIELFQNASELETKLRPFRTIIFSILKQFYQWTEPLELCFLEDMWSKVDCMLEGLLCITQLQKVLLDLREHKSFERSCQFKTAADLEYKLRPLRIIISAFLGTLYQKVLKPISLRELLSAIDGAINDLHMAQSGILAIHKCPRQEGIEGIIERGLPAYLDFISQYEVAFARYQARTNSLSALERLSAFFSEDLFSTLRANIQDNRSNLSELQPIADSLPSLSSYQEFRLHVPSLSREALRIFSVLREKDKELKGYPKDQLAGIIKRLIGREARLAWKDRIEQKFPVLQLSRMELTRKVRSLDEANTKIRELNQRFLSSNRGLNGLSSTENWEDITRLRGPRARRLRELIERGSDMGLMQLRSVWLMNPDTASRLLPLRAGMFDVVIYDEASQIPVENALPTLYRAKRCIISGDDKQMPPTSAFKKRFSDDEEQSFDDEDLDEIMSEAEREALEDSWNRKEIKDCADLLTLGKMVLPRCMLQIHYRSRYRELIAFSNAAFYGNQLSIPVRHPESVIQKIRPIEVIRVNGIYTDQTNREEAEKVVDLLAERWLSTERPSIGVVTFNIHQADLIEDILAERSANHLDFRQVLTAERERQQGGEDMSFFVKNVENVQGDERDMIIFSSTFGHNGVGSFRRQFGLLGQTGGERRLNVGITRAREKIILVTSLPINEISDALSKHEGPRTPKDYLQGYFDYASKISDGSLEMAGRSLERMSNERSAFQISSNFNKDGFVRSVAEFIKRLGLTPSTIKESDAFGLDFVIEDSEKKGFGIGIECDAHCHPILETARAREIWRPKVLRLGIPFVHRVTCYGWYHRRTEEKERLKQALEHALGVTFTGLSMTGWEDK